MKYYECQGYVRNMKSNLLNRYMANLPDNYCWCCELTSKYFNNKKQLISGSVNIGGNGWTLYVYDGNRIGTHTKNPTKKEYMLLLKELIFT